MRTFWLARSLCLATVVYLLIDWSRSSVIGAPFLAASAAALVLFGGVLRRPRRNGRTWVLPITTTLYTLGILAALTLHLLLGLPAGDRIAPSAFLLLGIAIGLRSTYKATTPPRTSRPGYFDPPARASSSSGRQHARGERERRPKRDG